LDRIPIMRVLNKQDLVGPKTVRTLARKWDGVPISANDEHTLAPLLEKIELHIGRLRKRAACAGPPKPLAISA
jgi:50S ribosomal subunit-associated GTPase HflX